MEITDKNTEKIKLVPFAVIQKAVEGDIVSINKVLKHYEGYISCLAVRRMYDKYGNEYYCSTKDLKVLIVDADPKSDVSAGFGYRDCDDSNEILAALMDAVMKDEDIPSER